MTSKLEPRIEAIRLKYDLQHSDFWQIKQNGQWVCKHAALEIIAVKANVEWLPPQIIEANAPALVTSMVVTGKMGDRIEWATGETNETNYSIRGKQPAYPWAMSEKRAKDRVVLKLVGIHGLVYSEDEAEDFKEPDARTTDQRSEAGRREVASQQPHPSVQAHIDSIRVASTMDGLKTAFEKGWRAMAGAESAQASIKAAYDARKAALAPADDFPGDTAPNSKKAA